MKTITFNTGRKYTAEGQVIKATLHEDGIVTFFDHSRSIDGQFAILDDVFFNKETIMSEYDAGRYKSTQQSRQDGMYRGGCNTRS